MADTTPRIDIRMYRHGLGDSFLLTFHGKNGSKTMLIDCGIVIGTTDRDIKMQKVMQDIVDKLRGDGEEAVLDYLVITHEHYDHISGFELARDIFTSIRVKELWMSWVEDPNDAFAKNEVKQQLRRATRALVSAIRRKRALGLNAATEESLLDFIGEIDEIDLHEGPGAREKINTLDFLRRHVKEKGGKVRYFDPEVEGGAMPSIDIDGIRIYVLGPPKDIGALKSENPRKRNQEDFHLREPLLDMEEEALFGALGLDGETDVAPSSNPIGQKNYPFSRNYCHLFSDYHQFLLANRLEEALKEDMHFLLLDMIIDYIETNGKIPEAEDFFKEKISAYPFSDQSWSLELEDRLKLMIAAATSKPLPKAEIIKAEAEKSRPLGRAAMINRLKRINIGRPIVSKGDWDQGEGQKISPHFKIRELMHKVMMKLLKDLLRPFIVDQEEPSNNLQVLKTAFQNSVDDHTSELLRDLSQSSNDLQIHLMQSILLEVSYQHINSSCSMERILDDLADKKLGMEYQDLEAILKKLCKNGRMMLNRVDYYLEIDKIEQENGTESVADPEKDEDLNLIAEILRNFTSRVDKYFDKPGKSHYDINLLGDLLSHLRKIRPMQLLQDLQPIDRIIMRYENEEEQWRKIDEDWLESTGDLALKLDRAVNNTSLVLAIELTAADKVLLFPGDAQAGSWRSWPERKFTLPDGGEKTGRQLLEKTVFYKVGHHGSHNATINEGGLSLMTHPELVAMVAVDKETADRKHWFKMPQAELMNAVHQKARGKLLLADEKIALKRKFTKKDSQGEVLNENVSAENGLQLDEQVRKEFKAFRKKVKTSRKRLGKHPDGTTWHLYYDYTIE